MSFGLSAAAWGAIGSGVLGLGGAYLNASGAKDAASAQNAAAAAAAQLDYQRWLESRGLNGNAVLPMYMGDFESNLGGDIMDIYQQSQRGNMSEENLASLRADYEAMISDPGRQEWVNSEEPILSYEEWEQQHGAPHKDKYKQQAYDTYVQQMQESNAANVENRKDFTFDDFLAQVAQDNPGDPRLDGYKDPSNQMLDDTLAEMEGAWGDGNDFINEVLSGEHGDKRQALVEAGFDDATATMLAGYDEASAGLESGYEDVYDIFNQGYSGASGTLYDSFGKADDILGESYWNALTQTGDAYGQAAGTYYDSYGQARNDIADNYGAAAGTMYQSYGRADDVLGRSYTDAIGSIWDTYGQGAGTLFDSYGKADATLGERYGDAVGAAGQGFDAAMGALGGRFQEARDSVNSGYDAGEATLDTYEGRQWDTLERDRELNDEASTARRAAINTGMGDQVKDIEFDRMRTGLGGQSSFGNNLLQGATIGARQQAALGDIEDDRRILQEEHRLNQLYQPQRTGLATDRGNRVGDLYAQEGQIGSDIRSKEAGITSDLYSRWGDQSSDLKARFGDTLSDAQFRMGDAISGLQTDYGTKAADLYTMFGDNLSGMQTDMGELLADGSMRFGDTLGDAQMRYGDRVGDLYTGWGDAASRNKQLFGQLLSDAQMRYGDRGAALAESEALNQLGLDKDQVANQLMLDQGLINQTLGGFDANTQLTAEMLDEPLRRAKMAAEMGNMQEAEMWSNVDQALKRLNFFNIGTGTGPSAYVPDVQPDDKQIWGAGLTGLANSGIWDLFGGSGPANSGGVATNTGGWGYGNGNIAGGDLWGDMGNGNYPWGG